MTNILSEFNKWKETYTEITKSVDLLEYSYLNDIISEEVFEKARKGKYADTAENRKLKRVGQEYGSKKQEEQTVEKEKKGEPEKDGKQPSIEEHARTASETALQNAAKGGDEELRIAAKKELERREKEENPSQKEEQDSKESPIDEASSKIEEELNKKDEPISKKQREKNFKEWFGDSKVVDEKGKPKKVFHGTYSDFKEFKPKSDNYGDRPEAIYFSDSKKTSSFYGDKIMEVYLKMENPLEVDMEGESFHTDTGYYKYSRALEEAKESGYDGVIATNMIDTKEPNQKAKPSTIYVIFNSNQIKSATENDGNFDKNSNDITKSNEDESWRKWL